MGAIGEESMSSGDARGAIRSSQDELRALALQALTLAGDGAASDEALRAQGRRLCAAVQAHLDFEERMMATALADVLGLEGVLLVQLEADHQRQLSNAAATLSVMEAFDLTRPRLIASIRALAESVLLDLDREERTFMTADVDELANDSPGG
jgi:hypothetical protein